MMSMGVNNEDHPANLGTFYLKNIPFVKRVLPFLHGKAIG